MVVVMITYNGEGVYDESNLLEKFELIPSALSFLKKRRQPRSTLFPYTTLFRSLVSDAQTARAQARPYIEVKGVSQIFRRGGATTHADRKSTRLNSSHVSISYAVFCLKKKNIMTFRRVISTKRKQACNGCSHDNIQW